MPGDAWSHFIVLLSIWLFSLFIMFIRVQEGFTAKGKADVGKT